MKFLIINGPNLNMLGLREPGIYGDRNYAALCALCEEWCAEVGVECELFQSNHEGYQRHQPRLPVIHLHDDAGDLR